MKRKGFLFAAAFCALLAFAGFNAGMRDAHLPHSDSAANFVLAVITSVLTVLFCWKAFQPTKSKKYTEWQNQRMREAANLTALPVIIPRSIILKANEICHYQSNASVLVVKNQVVGHTGGYQGVSVRVMKGLTLHTGGNRGQTIRRDVQHTYPGLFTITNQRIIMTGDQGFDFSFDKLTALTVYSDGVGLQFGKNTYTILLPEPYWVPKVIDLILAGAPTEPFGEQTH